MAVMKGFLSQPHWSVQCQIFDSASLLVEKIFRKTHNKLPHNSIFNLTRQMMRVKNKTVSGRATGLVTDKEKAFFFIRDASITQ